MIIDHSLNLLTKSIIFKMNGGGNDEFIGSCCNLSLTSFVVADSFHCSQVNHIAKVMDDARIGLGPIHFVPVSDVSKVTPSVLHCYFYGIL